MSESRLHKSFLNAKVNVLFYVITLFISFFSRKIFLEQLGADFIGLTGTLQNLLGFLNLANLGIGASMGYILYKPLFEKDREKLREIISVLGYLYRYVGLSILVSGGILPLFFPLIFKNTEFEPGVIYFAYFSFLASSLIGYFVNYRQVLLGADQRNYVVTAYSQTANLVKTLLQMALVCYTGSYYLWIAIELIFGLLYSLVLNRKIDQVYPWLKCSVAVGKEKYEEHKIIIRKSRQLFVHVLAGTGRSQLLPFLVYAFTSLKLVAYYGNYMLLITKLNLLVNNLLGSTGAGVGHLIAEGDQKRIQQVFWELNSLRFVIAGFFTFALYHLIDPFITIWLGADYVLPHSVLIIILANFFVSQYRGTVDQFINGYGLYHDTWAPIVTLIITVVVALAGGSLWGLPGVLLGDIASSLTIVCVWKVYFLYKHGFKRPVSLYWKNIVKYAALFVLSWSAADGILFVFPLLDPTNGYGSWILYAFYSSTLFLLIFISLFYIFSDGMRLLSRRVRRKVFRDT